MDSPAKRITKDTRNSMKQRCILSPAAKPAGKINMAPPANRPSPRSTPDLYVCFLMNMAPGSAKHP